MHFSISPMDFDEEKRVTSVEIFMKYDYTIEFSLKNKERTKKKQIFQINENNK